MNWRLEVQGTQETPQPGVEGEKIRKSVEEVLNFLLQKLSKKVEVTSAHFYYNYEDEQGRTISAPMELIRPEGE